MSTPTTSSDLLRLGPVIPVAVLHEAATAVPTAQALAAGGVRVIEVTLRTPTALDCIEQIATKVPEVVVGAGTVITPAQAEQARARGAQFLVTPGSTPQLVQAALGTGLPTLPGAATVTESLALLEQGFTAQKFFPAQASGGVEYLKSVEGPLPDVEFCPTGGVSTSNVESYLAAPNVVCVGGSWLTPTDAVEAQDWARIERLAHAASTLRRD